MMMSPSRRILVVDDQQHIHDTFKRLFGPSTVDNSALEDFESRFLQLADGPNKIYEFPTDLARPVYELTHAHRGDHAVELVRESVKEDQRFHVAFVDMRMPCGMDGLETIEAIWKLDSHLQVVVCTAYSDHSWENVLDQLGRNDRLLLLRKPFESDEARQLALALSEKSRLEKIQRQEFSKLENEIVRRRNAEAELHDDGAS